MKYCMLFGSIAILMGCCEDKIKIMIDNKKPLFQAGECVHFRGSVYKLTKVLKYTYVMVNELDKENTNLYPIIDGNVYFTSSDCWSDAIDIKSWEKKNKLRGKK